ncbi:MAG: lipopolysaccharide heptosyltransferase II [Planctomycetota bacterium]
MAPAPEFDPARVRSVFVRAPNWLGDFVMATSAFERIRRGFPSARITAGMRPHLKGLLGGVGFFDGVVETPRARGPLGLWRQVSSLRRIGPEVAVVLPNSLETGLVPFLARVPWRLGYQQGRPGLLNLGVSFPVRRRWFQRRMGPRRWPRPMPHHYGVLLDRIGLPAVGFHPRLSVTDEERSWVDRHLAALGIGPEDETVLFVVGANFGASKLWMPERFAAAARHFERKGLRSLVVVGPAEVELGRQIARKAGVIGLTDPVLGLGHLKALVSRCSLMITGDTGPRHLAVAFDRPIVCLMGPNDPGYTAYCLDATTVIRKDLPCSPCQRKVCPLGHHRCMRDITVEEVVRAGESMLDRARRARDREGI